MRGFTENEGLIKQAQMPRVAASLTTTTTLYVILILMCLSDADTGGNPKNMVRGWQTVWSGGPLGCEGHAAPQGPQWPSGLYGLPSKDHIFFADRAPLGRDTAKESTGRGKAEPCATWVTSCVRFAEAHKAYIFLLTINGP